MSSRDEWTEGKVGWAVLRQGLPVALGLAAHALFNLADLVMVGRLGEDAVAGVHCATVVNFLPMIIGNSVSVAILSIMSRDLGAGRTDVARTLSSWSQGGMFLLGVVLGVAGWLCAGPSIAMQGVSGAAYDVGLDYLVVSHLGTFTMFVLMQTTTTMRAVGASITPALLLVGANALNLLLNYLLIFGWEAVGVPAFGAVGAAYATILARLVAASIGLIVIARTEFALPLRWVGWRAPAGALASISALSLPSTAQMLVRACAVLVLTRWTAAAGGADAVVAIGVTTRLESMVVFASMGYAGAATAIVGHAVGAGAVVRARVAARHAGLQSWALGMVFVAVFAVCGGGLIELFVADASAAVVTLGATYLVTGAVGQPFAGCCLAWTGALHGAGRMVRPLVIDVVGHGLGLGCGLLFVDRLGVLALWLGYFGFNLLLALAHALHLEFGNWVPSEAGRQRSSA